MSLQAVSNYAQFRTFTNLYLFKIKEGDLHLKVCDLSQRSILKQTFSSRDLGNVIIQDLLKTPFSILSLLVEKNLLDQQYLPLPKLVVTNQNGLTGISDMITILKGELSGESKELESFCCPITGEVFRHPVIDKCGHTFEHEAIKAWLSNHNTCPVSRKNITIDSLAPNLMVKSRIEDLQKQDPIPTFSSFSKVNNKLATRNLEMAKEYIGEKEYDEALKSYATAFKFTKNWEDYASLPTLFLQMNEPQKATLAFLYLSLYQLKANKPLEAIETIKQCANNQKLNLLLIKLYRLTNQSSLANELSIEVAKTTQQNQLAISLYKDVLIDNPNHFTIYLLLSQLLANPEKTHVLLTGACRALHTRNHKNAEDLFQEAYKNDVSFFDRRLYLHLLVINKKHSEIISRLQAAADDYAHKNLFSQMAKTYKLLFQINKKATYCRSIIDAKQRLNKDCTPWFVECLSLFIQEKNWPDAEKTALQALSQTPNKRPIYEKLEIIYTHWQEHKLEKLWGNLGQCYLQKHDLSNAERVYRLSFEQFGDFTYATFLASVLIKQNKTREGIQIYYEAISIALINNDLNKVLSCIDSIREVDPNMRCLNLSQRISLSSNRTLLQLSHQFHQTQEVLVQTHKRLEVIEKKVSGLESFMLESFQKKAHKVQQLEKRRLAEQKRLELEEIKRLEAIKIREQEVFQFAFGKASWAKHFGDVGIEPPLPKNIVEILQGPCPIWEGKKVSDTHLLVLIPQLVDGRPLSLNLLEELIQKPKVGPSTKYEYYNKKVKIAFGNKSISSSYWVLFSKDVIPGSRKKTFLTQCKLVQELVKKSRVPYEVPTSVEASVSILMHHVKVGERLYSNDPLTYTRCQEEVDGKYPVAVGGFSSGGFHIYTYPRYYGRDRDGMAVSQKL